MNKLFKTFAFSILVSTGFICFCYLVDLLSDGIYSFEENILKIFLFAVLGIPLMAIGFIQVLRVNRENEKSSDSKNSNIETNN